MKFIKDLFKGPQNLYWDYGRVWVGVGLVVFFAIVIHKWLVLREFDEMGFGTALAAVLGAGVVANAYRDSKSGADNG